MKLENWIAIANLIATLASSFASPLFAIWLQKRFGRPKTRAQVGQPRLLKFFIRLLASQGLTLIFAVFGIVIGVYFLFNQVSSQEPITRSAVFSIAFFTGSIMYHLILSLFALSMREITSFQAKLVDSYGNLVSGFSRVVDLHDALVETIDEHESKLSKPKTKKSRV